MVLISQKKGTCKGEFAPCRQKSGKSAKYRAFSSARSPFPAQNAEKPHFTTCKNIDPSIVRVLWAVLALAAGTGVLAYIACAIILPEGDTEV